MNLKQKQMRVKHYTQTDKQKLLRIDCVLVNMKSTGRVSVPDTKPAGNMGQCERTNLIEIEIGIIGIEQGEDPSSKAHF